MVKVVWTEIAIEDLRSIHDYISKDSERVDQLESFPNSGRIVPEFTIEKIRELIEGNYRIVYEISADQISIVRIHNSARLLK
jgi:toxin ParE1/3/4